MKRITAFLLFIAVTFTIISPSMLHVAADEITDIVVGEQETVTETLEKTEKITTTEVDGIVVEISGDALPKDAEVVADTSPDEKTEALSDIIVGESDEENNACSLDISLESEGVTAQPEKDSVRVSLSGINLEDCDTVTVYHVMDDVSSIAKRLESESGFVTYTLDGEATAHFEKEIAAFNEAVKLAGTEETFDENTICVEDISTDNGLIVDLKDGIVSFDTDSFSTYYVVKGNKAERVYSTNSIIKFGSFSGTKTDTFMISPDSTLTFFSADKDWNSELASTWSFDAKGSLMTYKKASDSKSATVSIPADAKIGSSATLTVKYGKKTYTATLTVAANDTNIDKARTHYRVMLTVVPEPHKDGIPTEPSIATGFGWKIINGNYVVAPTSAQGTKFADNGSNIIKDTIKNVLTQSIDGSHTWGYFNTEGDIKNYLQNIDWDKALDKLIAYGGFYGTDGVKVTNSNKNNYELIPYVIKLQSLSGASWNIDCYIKRKQQVTLSYDANLGTGVTVQNTFGLPNSKTVNKGDRVTVGKISYNGGSENLSVGSTISVKGPDGLSYTYKFLGWGTDRTKINNNYDPGDKPVLNSNIKLYAIWGKSVKVCYNANGGVINSDEHSLGRDNFIDKNGSRYYQNWNYDDTTDYGLTNNTSFGLSRPGYVFNQWNTKADGSGVTIHQDDKTVKSSILEKYLEDKEKSRCLKLYAQWIPGYGQIKISTVGLDPKDKDQTFIFVVSGISDLGEKIELRIPIKGDGTAIVTDVPFGTYTVHCESDWSWRYKSSDDVIVEVKEMNKTYNADFIQKRTDARWLSGCAYKKNEFEEKGND